MDTRVRRNLEQSSHPNALEIWRAPAWPGIVFHRGTGFSHRYPKHWHEELHVCAYTGGSGHLSCQGTTHLIVPGDMVVTPPGEVHENWVTRGSSISFCGAYLDLTGLRSAKERFDNPPAAPPTFRIETTRSPVLLHAFLRMYRAMEASDSLLHCDQTLMDFLNLLAMGYSSSARPPATYQEHRATRRVREYIAAYFSDPISLAQLGSVAELSPFHTQRVFRREAGMSPHEYQTQLRINCAKRMLRENHPLSEIAVAAGFSDQSHLTRHFRRRVGLTPGRYCALFFPSNRKIVQDETPRRASQFPPAETIALGRLDGSRAKSTFL